ncbi:hypothetical protein RRG08_066706 [Elysia crispata]|uniref:Uncharacterized protein n=1 Tax=Elysia crispata TaxID=231223 RepID=A0AAE0ZRV8_9GAST|nr:hypothetical protein RRG08_066706 [Elysia crispata]
MSVTVRQLEPGQPPTPLESFTKLRTQGPSLRKPRALHSLLASTMYRHQAKVEVQKLAAWTNDILISCCTSNSCVGHFCWLRDQSSRKQEAKYRLASFDGGRLERQFQ